VADLISAGLIMRLPGNCDNSIDFGSGKLFLLFLIWVVLMFSLLIVLKSWVIFAGIPIKVSVPDWFLVILIHRVFIWGRFSAS